MSLSGADANAGWRESREKYASGQKPLEAQGARRSPARVRRAGLTGRRPGGYTHSSGYEAHRRPGQRTVSLRGSGRQRGRCRGTRHRFRVRPLRAYLAPELRPGQVRVPEPARPRDERHPEKVVRRKFQRIKARAARGGEGSFVKGPLREVVLGEPSGQDPQRRLRWQVPWANWRRWGDAPGTGATHLFRLHFGLPGRMAWPALGNHLIRLLPCGARTFTFPARCAQSRFPPLSAWPQLHSSLGERAGCPRAMGISASLGAPAASHSPVFLSSHSAFLAVERGRGLSSPPPLSLWVLATERWKRPAPDLPTSPSPRDRWTGQEELGRVGLQTLIAFHSAVFTSHPHSQYLLRSVGMGYRACSPCSARSESRAWTLEQRLG